MQSWRPHMLYQQSEELQQHWPIAAAEFSCFLRHQPRMLLQAPIGERAKATQSQSEKILITTVKNDYSQSNALL